MKAIKILHCCPVNFSELSTTIAMSAITISARAYIYTIRDMNWNPLPETRCPGRYKHGIHVRSDAASMQHTVSGNGFHFLSLTVNGTAVKILLLLITALMLTACASPKRGDLEYAPARPVSYTGPIQYTDSIYQAESAWLLHEDIKPRRVGDMLTVMLQEKTDAKKKADTDTKKASNTSITASTLLGLPITSGDKQVLDTKLSSAYDFAGEGGSNQSNSLSGSVTVSVVEVLFNGHLVVQGEKWININQGEEYIRLRGIVRPADIGPDNSISSERVANAQIQYSGEGNIADANEQGWLAKFFNSSWMPF